jgi:hypothetical protein
VNPDTGEAETPVHGRALSWRRDLDYKIDQYERKMDRERDVDEKIAAMTPAEKDDMIKAALLQQSGGPFAGLRNNQTLDAQPNSRSPLMRRLTSGQPISRGDLRKW